MVTYQTLYESTQAGRLEVYNAYLAAGKGTPFLYPWDTFPVLYLFIGIVIRPYLSRRNAQVSGCTILAMVVAHSFYIVNHRRTVGMAGGYGMGLIATWGVIMTAVLLILHDSHKDFVRLELREAAHATAYTQAPEGVSYSIDQTNGQQHVRARQNKDFTQTFVPKSPKTGQHTSKYRLIWQPYPTEIWHIIDWTIDLITSFRGPNWNFRISSMSKIQTLPLPPGYKASRAIEPSIRANEHYDPTKPSPTLMRNSILHTAFLYILTDILKSLMVTDVYFLGLRPLDAPTTWPYLNTTPTLLRFTRLTIALTSIITCLSLIFSLAPLCLTTLPHLLPQSLLIHLTKSPLYDPRMYDPQFLSVFPTIPARGLAGLWGTSWHQMFRHGITAPALVLCAKFDIPLKSQLGRAVQLLIAFALSGLLHAVASATTFSIVPSRPWDPWFFFMAQAVGIMVQTWVADFLQKTLKMKLPMVLRQVGNTMFVVGWLWLTGPLLADDFARGGIWLFEPCPISFVRGFAGRGWWCWGGRWVGVWRGEGWLDSGIAIF